MESCIGFVKISKTSYSDVDGVFWCLKFCCVWFFNRKNLPCSILNLCVTHSAFIIIYSPIISKLCLMAAGSLKILILCGTFCHKSRCAILY